MARSLQHVCLLVYVVAPPAGIEPATKDFKDPCSTAELQKPDEVKDRDASSFVKTLSELFYPCPQKVGAGPGSSLRIEK